MSERRVRDGMMISDDIIINMTIKQIEGYQIYMSKLLGKGSYGSVFIGKKDHTNEPVAVKILPK